MCQQKLFIKLTELQAIGRENIILARALEQALDLIEAWWPWSVIWSQFLFVWGELWNHEQNIASI